ncbi:MAG: AAA family ATPase [Gammaproteobacteria bacterium]|nr:AAA family ATPase [Gammaproteobacteria bacterium]
MATELASEALLRRVDESTFPFTTTAELKPVRAPVAQTRARDALEFGVGMQFPGYNVYALGSSQTDKRALVTGRLQALAADQNTPDDWCYLQNFDDPARPHSVNLPAGVGRRFRHHMQEFVANVRSMVPAALASDEYRGESRELASSLQDRQSSDAAELEAEAREHGLVMLPSPNGFVFAPMRDGKVMEEEAFLTLDEGERQRVHDAIELMTNRLLERLREYPQYQQQLVTEQRELVRKTSEEVVVMLLARVRQRYQAHGAVMEYLNAVQGELLDNVDKIVALEHPTPQTSFLPAPDPERFLERFKVNLIVDSSELEGAPVLYESNPSLDNLVGKLEHRMEFGTPVTDFNLIRPGALHRANGGYLLLDAERLIQKPFAWEAVKRAVADNSVRIETVSQLMNLTYSVSLEPAPIALDVKIVLLGSRQLYHLLRRYDADFDELFKVVADFDDDVDWTDENVSAYVGLIAETVAEAGIKHLEGGAVARVLEHSSRMVEDRERLSTHICDIRDLLREADLLAGRDGAQLIGRDHVTRAIEQRVYRLDRFRELIRENVARGLILVETAGAKVGQINGLSVVSIGQLTFGQPLRITATARLGRGELIDIERESHLGGKIHTKAVMIVSSFLGSRYARENPLSLHASLVFEQSYGGVEGDSASIAEVCALISAIIDRPIKQSLAVTGSMDQHGVVQAIGGVNEKIEGFFDICVEQGLSGEQGVVIPVTNRDHLMLRQDVVDAVANKQFHVYTMSTVDDAMELLFAPLGETETDTHEIDEAVCDRIKQWHDIWRESAKGRRDDE